MRSMYPDSEYYEHLDELRLGGEWNPVLAPVSLMDTFPGLRADEARAVCNDWRATYHERMGRPATRAAQASSTAALPLSSPNAG